ncbi:MAG: hypothetical protein LH613_15260 [Chamaesiphon sp.]|nr:hypothetical protein [Chamaesiphon sp.]
MERRHQDYIRGWQSIDRISVNEIEYYQLIKHPGETHLNSIDIGRSMAISNRKVLVAT